MCLVLLAVEKHPNYKLVIAANRDEYYDRSSSKAGFWKEAPEILAGRDLVGGGTWLGISKKGRIGLLTNYRDPQSRRQDAPSRGALVSGYLLGKQSPVQYLEEVREKHTFLTASTWSWGTRTRFTTTQTEREKSQSFLREFTA